MKIFYYKLDAKHLNLTIKADTDYDRFADFAVELAQILDCKVLKQQKGADRHQWLLDFEGCHLWLHYEFYGDICWLNVEQKTQLDVLRFLSQLLPCEQLT